MATVKKAPKPIKAKEFDRRFDAGEDMGDYMDMDNATKQVLIDFPLWMVQALDTEAKRLGVARQYVIKSMIDAALKAQARPAAGPRRKASKTQPRA